MGPMFMLYQGSTPTLELVLPIELQPTDVVYATFSQDEERVLEYHINGTNSVVPPPPAGTLRLDVHDGHTLLLEMTQADTFRLQPGDTELQLRIKTEDGADTFIPALGYVGKARKEGVIT